MDFAEPAERWDHGHSYGPICQVVKYHASEDLFMVASRTKDDLDQLQSLLDTTTLELLDARGIIETLRDENHELKVSTDCIRSYCCVY